MNPSPGNQAKSSSWRRWIEPWYVAYALLGVTVAGIAPILLPLAVSRSGSIAAIGLVMAAFNLGGLAAPLWGDLADRYHWHRGLMIGGLLTTAAALAAFAFSDSFALWLVFALAQGAGAAAAATVANLFVVESHPKEEWDERIGWLQTFYGAGQVGGLLLAGVLSQAELRVGLLTAAALTALALVPGSLVKRAPLGAAKPRPVLLHPARQAHWSPGSPQHSYHRPSWTALKQIALTQGTPFAAFLAAWLLSFAGAAAFFSLYPVLMQQLYRVTPEFSSAGFAIAAAIGLALYAPAGRWSVRLGPLRVLQAALVVRLVAFLGLLMLGITSFANLGGLSLLGFLFVVLAWSLLSVTGTALAAQFSPAKEGEGIGVFNASTALAGVAGAGLGGGLAESWGYNAVTVIAVVGVFAGLLLTAAIARSKKNA